MKKNAFVFGGHCSGKSERLMQKLYDQLDQLPVGQKCILFRSDGTVEFYENVEYEVVETKKLQP